MEQRDLKFQKLQVKKIQYIRGPCVLWCSNRMSEWRHGNFWVCRCVWPYRLQGYIWSLATYMQNLLNCERNSCQNTSHDTIHITPNTIKTASSCREVQRHSVMIITTKRFQPKSRVFVFTEYRYFKFFFYVGSPTEADRGDLVASEVGFSKRL